MLPDYYRGIVVASTEFSVTSTSSMTLLRMESERDITSPGCIQRSERAIPGVVNVTTSDEEVFPVKRRLLRPCIALTSVGNRTPTQHLLPLHLQL